MNDNEKTFKISNIFYGAIALIIFSIIFLYASGFRLTTGLKIGKVGKVSITIPIQGTSIFIDESDRIVTTKDGEVVDISLSPKEHSIIISRENYFPWKKDLNIKSGQEVNLAAIFVSQNPSGNIITKNDPEYLKIKNLIRNNKTPTKNAPKNNLAKSVNIWVENNTIMAETSGKIISVVKPETEIKNLEFYKDRSDAVIYSTNNAIFVIEIDGTGTQNFMPIYKGSNPYFTIDDPDYIYVLDDDNLMQVII